MKPKWLKQFDWCCTGMSSIYRDSAWRGFNKRFPFAGVFVDVYYKDKLQYENILLFTVCGCSMQVWRRSEDGEYEKITIPNNTQWRIELNHINKPLRFEMDVKFARKYGKVRIAV